MGSDSEPLGNKLAVMRWLIAYVLLALFVASIVLLCPWSPFAVVRWLGPHPVQDTQIHIKKIEEALMLYAIKHEGAYPERLEDARKYLPDGHESLDAWGNPLIYVPTGATPYVIISLGADGRAGGTGLDADIWSESAAGR